MLLLRIVLPGCITILLAKNFLLPLDGWTSLLRCRPRFFSGVPT
ncbi:hypothetical protein HRbin36_01685 [bacterium HR36]|nr:hypothetical protein HRbin36_01685 [bacterium HR36]